MAKQSRPADDLGQVRLFLQRLIKERDQAREAKRVDAARQTSAVSSPGPIDAMAFWQRSRLSRLLTRFAPPYQEAPADTLLRLALAELRTHPTLLLLAPKLEEARELHRQLLDEIEEAAGEHRGGEALERHCRAITGIARYLPPVVQEKRKARSPGELSDVDKLAAAMDTWHKRNGLVLGRIEVRKFCDYATDLKWRTDQVTRTAQKLFKCKKPQTTYRRLAMTKRRDGNGLAEILAAQAGEITKENHRGELSGSIPDVSQATPDKIAEGQELLDSLRGG